MWKLESPSEKPANQALEVKLLLSRGNLVNKLTFSSIYLVFWFTQSISLCKVSILGVLNLPFNKFIIFIIPFLLLITKFITFLLGILCILPWPIVFNNKSTNGLSLELNIILIVGLLLVFGLGTIIVPSDSTNPAK